MASEFAEHREAVDALVGAEGARQELAAGYACRLRRRGEGAHRQQGRNGGIEEKGAHREETIDRAEPD